MDPQYGEAADDILDGVGGVGELSASGSLSFRPELTHARDEVVNNARTADFGRGDGYYGP
jgi:hypothetical protein